jgi:DNA-binding transcriptional ArsR family regulator
MSNHKNGGSLDPSSSLDPSRFQIRPGDVAPKKVVREGRRISSVGGKFIAGPVDVTWLSQARKLGVAALWVGLGLWFLRGLRRSDSFIVSNLILREWNVLPDAKRRALRALEKAGLITVERRGKRSPRVTLVVQFPEARRRELHECR